MNADEFLRYFLSEDQIARFRALGILRARKKVRTFAGEFTIDRMSSGFYKLITGEYPEASTIEQADFYGKTPQDLEKEK